MGISKVVYFGEVLQDLSNDTVTEAKMLSGVTAHDAAGNAIVGSIQSQAAQTITPGAANKTIAAGKYLAGTQTIKGDANLIAENIKAGVSIFGVAGTYETELFAVISVTYPAGSTCTCTMGSKVLAAPDTSGKALFNVPELGTWTVTATDGSDTVSKTVSIAAEGQIESVKLNYQTFAFSANDQHTDITGGWSSGGKTTYGTATIGATLSISLSSTGGGIYIRTVNKIDMSKYSKIRFNGYSADANYAAFGAATGLAENMGYDPGSYFAAYVRPGTARTDKYVDVSSLTGSYYIAVSAYRGTSHNSAPVVYEIELIE